MTTTPTTFTPTDELPVLATINSEQDRGRSIHLAGFNTTGRRALIIDHDNSTVSIANVNHTNSLGQWECSTAHLDAHRDLYSDRFPIGIDERDAWLSYVAACEAENLEHHDPHMWRIHGRPTSLIG